MTYCKTLMIGKTREGDTVAAWECWDKDSRLPRYEITIDRGNTGEIGYSDTIPTARTTWRRKFREIVTGGEA